MKREAMYGDGNLLSARGTAGHRGPQSQRLTLNICLPSAAGQGEEEMPSEGVGTSQDGT